MTITTTNTPDTASLRDRLDRLTRATADLTPGAHKLLINSLNTLGALADQIDSIDIGDWNTVHSYAMACIENMETARTAGRPFEEHSRALQHYLATLAGIIRRALGDGDPEPEDVPGLGDSACPYTSVDAAPHQPASLLTGFDILDAYCALQNAADAHCTNLNTADRQALAYLTYWDGLRNITRMLLGKLANQTAALPLPPTLAVHLLNVAAYLPPVSDEDEDAWLAARDTNKPCVVDQIIDTLAAYTATRYNEPGGHLLDGALQTVIRVGQPGLPLHQVPAAAHAHIDAALDADGLAPAAQDDPVTRALRIIAGQAATHTGASAAALKWAMRTLIEETTTPTPPVTDVNVHAAHNRVDHLIREAHRRHSTPQTLDPADRILNTLAAYTADYDGDIGGGHMRTMLLAGLIATNCDVTPEQAVELARGDGWDPRVKAAGDARVELVERIKRDRLTAIDNEAWMPADGDTVTWNATDGTWIVRGYEDDDTVWIHRPDVAMVPAIGRASGNLVDLGGWRDEPAVAELVAVADLRPADQSTAVAL